MGEKIGRNIPSPERDLEAVAVEDGCSSELTRANSVDDESAVTIDGFIDFLHVNANASPGQPMKWTDKKHSLYLDHLEASFVNQLHQCRGLLGQHLQERGRDSNLTGKPLANPGNLADQFKVLHGGCWKKAKFGRNERPLDSCADSNVILKNPWICHFKSGGKRHMVTSFVQEESTSYDVGLHLTGKRTSAHNLASCQEQLYASRLCRQNSVASTTEVSDQNFEDEKQGNRSSSLSVKKRFKSDATDASSNDQVVPRGKHSVAEVAKDTSAVREECSNYQWVSENPESLVCPKSDANFFLRGGADMR